VSRGRAVAHGVLVFAFGWTAGYHRPPQAALTLPQTYAAWMATLQNRNTTAKITRHLRAGAARSLRLRVEL
jgi:hypothetical protein